MMAIFTTLNIYRDVASRSAAMNMAIDEALLKTATIPSIRFYRWDREALSFGYFGRFADAESCAAERDMVRRWTGGGIVFHGDDLTYSLVIPANDPLFAEPSMSIYERIHRALRDALGSAGERAELLAAAAVCDRRGRSVSAVTDRRYSQNACFTNPVRADVLMNGRKVAGAAQRRTRCGLLQQGSIQHVDLGNGLAERFASELCDAPVEKCLDDGTIEQAQEIAGQKYATTSWLRRR